MILLTVLTGVLGLVVGSFLNVVIYRVPRGESVVTPRSHCPACDRVITARDNVPVLSWLALRGRCRHCHARISLRYPVVELLTGVLFAVMALRFGASWALPAYLYLAAITVALAAIDLDVYRLPNPIVLPSYLVGAGLLLIPAVAAQRGDDALRALLGAAAVFAFYFLLAFIYPAGMGFGDVKLAGVLGMYLGWLGWAEVLVGVFAGFLLGGVVSIGMLTLRRVTRKTAIPFGPYLLGGALVGVLWGHAIAQAYLNTAL